MKITYVVAGIVALGIGTLLFFFLRPSFSAAPISSNATTTPNLPVAGNINSQGSSNITGMFSVMAPGGTPISVPDFRTDPAVIKVQEVEGDYYYILAGGSSAANTSPYQVTYDGDSGIFSIFIYKEPIGKYREEAEQVFIDKLGLTKAQICLLKPSVTTASEAAKEYPNQDLGVSFCSGSIVLLN